MIRLDMKKLQYDMNREAATISALSSGKIDKNKYLTGEQILPSDQRRVIEQAKFTYSPLRKALEKQRKIIEDQGRKEIDAISSQDERLVALTNKDDNKNNYKEIFEELVKERFDEIKELTDEKNHDNYYFKGNTAKKRFDDFNNDIELFRKIQSDKMKLEEVTKLQNVFKSNLNERSRGRNKSEEQKMPLRNIKLLYESRESVIKLFNDYSSIVS